MKVENNGAVVYVGSSLTVHHPLVFVHNLVSKFKMIEMLLNVMPGTPDNSNVFDSPKRFELSVWNFRRRLSSGKFHRECKDPL